MDIDKVILAGDLSLACPAFAVVRIQATAETEEIKVLHLGHVKTDAKKGLGHRLNQIQDYVQNIYETFEIDSVVVEKGFSRFHTATHQIQRVVGVFVYSSFTHGGIRSIDELSPTTVKKAITGDGKATKAALADHLEKYVGKIEYTTDDESDALGVAIAHMKKEGWLL